MLGWRNEQCQPSVPGQGHVHPARPTLPGGGPPSNAGRSYPLLLVDGLPSRGGQELLSSQDLTKISAWSWRPESIRGSSPPARGRQLHASAGPADTEASWSAVGSLYQSWEAVPRLSLNEGPLGRVCLGLEADCAPRLRKLLQECPGFPGCPPGVATGLFSLPVASCASPDPLPRAGLLGVGSRRGPRRGH